MNGSNYIFVFRYISTLYTKYQQTLRPSDFRKYIQHSLAKAVSMPKAFVEAVGSAAVNHALFGGKYPILINIYGELIGNILLEEVLLFFKYTVHTLFTCILQALCINY